MVKPFKFGSKIIGMGQPTYIIAEIGVNHEGCVEDCAKMIAAAAQAGVDAIKLQTCAVEENYVPGTESYDLFSKCELTQEETAQMFDYAWKFKVDPFTTSPDPRTLEWVDKLAPAGHKISSGMLTNPVIIRKSCETKRPILMSTGLASQEQVDESIAWVKEYGDLENTGLFQCTSIYPAPRETLNLAAIRGMEQRYSVNVGFSDHTDGVDVAALAVYAGANIIEKHFTLDKTRQSYDHHLSLEPKDMGLMVQGIREAEVIMGVAQKQVEGVLAGNAQKFLRCIVARRDIKEGDVLTEENIALKRPLPDNRGLDPKYYYDILGGIAKRALEKNDVIRKEHIKYNG